MCLTQNFRRFRAGFSFSLFASVGGVASVASAQAPAALPAPATAGATDVAKEGFQGTVAAPGPDSKDGTNLKLSAGAFIAQGNSRTISATTAADYLMRRGVSQLAAAAAANYGRSAPAAGDPSATTVENYQARVRYDYFFSNEVAGFGSISARRDRFQGLNLRLSVDPGVAYYFIDEKSHRFWAELGYDLQYDVRRTAFLEAAIAADPSLSPLHKHETRHNIRAFVGYDNQLAAEVKFNAGVEYLQNVADTDNARLNTAAALTSQLSSVFSIAATLAVNYDNNPLPGVKKTDVISALNLVYTISQ
jgi:putative salt-induced outer membrane protein YdiY